MFSGAFAPVSAMFVGLALTTSGLGHTNWVDISMVQARRFVFVFLLCGTIALAL